MQASVRHHSMCGCLVVLFTITDWITLSPIINNKIHIQLFTNRGQSFVKNVQEQRGTFSFKIEFPLWANITPWNNNIWGLKTQLPSKAAKEFPQNPKRGCKAATHCLKWKSPKWRNHGSNFCLNSFVNIQGADMLSFYIRGYFTKCLDFVFDIFSTTCT